MGLISGRKGVVWYLLEMGPEAKLYHFRHVCNDKGVKGVTDVL